MKEIISDKLILLLFNTPFLNKFKGSEKQINQEEIGSPTEIQTKETTQNVDITNIKWMCFFYLKGIKNVQILYILAKSQRTNRIKWYKHKKCKSTSP